MNTAEMDIDFPHERVLVRRGTRSRLPIVIAVHSTTLGQAIGGCLDAFTPNECANYFAAAGYDAL